MSPQNVHCLVRPINFLDTRWHFVRILDFSWNLAALNMRLPKTIISKAITGVQSIRSAEDWHFFPCTTGLVVKVSVHLESKRSGVSFQLTPWVCPGCDILVTQNWQSSSYPTTHLALQGQPSVSILWLVKVKSLICNLQLIMVAHELVWADPSLRYTSKLLGC